MPSVLVGRMVFVHFLGSRGVQHGNTATYHASSLVCLSTVSSLYQRRDKYQRPEDTAVTKLRERSDIAPGLERDGARVREIKRGSMRARKRGKKRPLIGLETRRQFLLCQIYLLLKAVDKRRIPSSPYVFVPFLRNTRSTNLAYTSLDIRD